SYRCFTLSLPTLPLPIFPSFFFYVPPTTEIYTLSLHDALPISAIIIHQVFNVGAVIIKKHFRDVFNFIRKICYDIHLVIKLHTSDRKSTRLNSSHSQISYAVFCLKKKKKKQRIDHL